MKLVVRCGLVQKYGKQIFPTRLAIWGAKRNENIWCANFARAFWSRGAHRRGRAETDNSGIDVGRSSWIRRKSPIFYHPARQFTMPVVQNFSVGGNCFGVRDSRKPGADGAVNEGFALSESELGEGWIAAADCCSDLVSCLPILSRD